MGRHGQRGTGVYRMRYWYIVDNEGQYSGKAKTFEQAYYRVTEIIAENPYKELNIINEQQYEDINIDGWCEGGLHIDRNGVSDVEYIESAEYWREEDAKAYRRSMIL